MTNKKTKNPVEIIKNEAKSYYKWKTMRPRYAVIWFLLLIIVLQFILPKSKNILSRQEVATWSSIEETQEYVFSFLWKEPDLDENFERSLAKILDKKNELSFIYKYKSDLLSKIWDELEAKDIPDEFKYFILLNHDQDTIFPIAGDQNKDFIVNEQINEKLNYHKSLDDFIKYSKLLLSNFKEWDLAVMWYFVWSDNLKSLMMSQNQTNFEDLYFPPNVLEKYYDLMAYAYVFDNISEYLDIENISIHEYQNVWKIKLWETKDLIKWAKKAKYDYKTIKTLNPWILQNSLPKWKREVVVPN